MTNVPPRSGQGGPASLVVGLRVLLLLGAVALVGAGFVLGWRVESATRASVARYACPMHPEVVAESAEQCPICKMALELTPAARPNPATSAPSRPAQSGTPKAGDASAAARPGYAASVPWLPETFPPAHAGTPQDGPAIGTPRRRTFVDDVRAPAWVEAPDRLAVLLYRDQLVGLSPGDRGMFLRGRPPSSPVEVRLSHEAPVRWDSSTSLVTFQIAAGPPARSGGPGQPPVGAAMVLQQGDVGWLEIPPTSRELLVFPESALLRGPEGPYVLIPGADGHTFTRRSVEIGRILKGHVVVLSGLGEGDRLVVGGAFFIEAQQRLAFEAGANKMGGAP